MNIDQITIDNEQLYNDYAKEMTKLRKEEDKLKSEWKKKLRGMVFSVNKLFNFLDGNDSWMPESIVTVIETDEKSFGYKSYRHGRVKDEKENHLYLRQNEDKKEIGVDHTYVWQTVGYLGDDYSGYLLLPLSDGTYFKVIYSC